MINYKSVDINACRGSLVIHWFLGASGRHTFRRGRPTQYGSQYRLCSQSETSLSQRAWVVDLLLPVDLNDELLIGLIANNRCWAQKHGSEEMQLRPCSLQ